MPDPTATPHPLADRIAQAIGDPHSVVGNRLSSTAWTETEEGYAPGGVEEGVVRWSTRAVLAVLAEADADAQREQDEYVEQMLADTGLAGMDFADGEARLQLVLAQEMATKMCLAFRTLLGAHPATVNYIEQEVRDRETGDRYVFIVVKPDGETPHQLRRRAEAERGAAVAALAAAARTLPAALAGEVTWPVLNEVRETLIAMWVGPQTGEGLNDEAPEGAGEFIDALSAAQALVEARRG